MKIIFIGAGNLATQLAKALLKAGHDIVQVYSRTMESASTLATLAGGAPTTDLGEGPQGCRYLHPGGEGQCVR
jgi:3-hydroxyisobutyrate dehydrogenase-like beta-hydroxyacid dehydrogenase